MRDLVSSGAGAPAPAAAGAADPARRAVRWRAAAAAGLIAAVAAVAAGAAVGWWFAPFLAGLAIGFVGRSGRPLLVFPAAAAVAAAGWTVPLLWLAVRGEPVAATARTVAALAGLPPVAALILGATGLVAVAQAAAGVWLARAAAGPPRRPR